MGPDTFRWFADIVVRTVILSDLPYMSLTRATGRLPSAALAHTDATTEYNFLNIKALQDRDRWAMLAWA